MQKCGRDGGRPLLRAVAASLWKFYLITAMHPIQASGTLTFVLIWANSAVYG